MKKLTINEQIFLVAIWNLGDDAYGVRIRENIMDMTGGSIMFGTVYNTLDKLVKKGYIVTKKGGEATAERGGYKKVYYSITQDGMEALRKAKALQDTLWAQIPQNAL